MNDILLFFTLKYKGNWEQIYSALAEKEKVDSKELKKINNKIKSYYISIIDDNYPNSLKQIYKPPFSLFWKGNLTLLNKSMITLVGNDFESEEEFKKIIEYINDYVFVLSYEQKELIEKMLEFNFKIIVVYNDGLKKIEKNVLYKKIIDNNNLLFTEIPCNNENVYYEQYTHRLLLGISRKVVYLDRFKIKNFQIIESICQMESIPIFTLQKNKQNKFKFIESLKEIKTHEMS